MFLTLAVGLLGGLLGIRLRLPAGALIGSMLAVAALGLAGHPSEPVPPILRNLGKILVGTVVGSAVTVSTLREIRPAALPALLVAVLLIGAGLLGGWLLSYLSGMDLATALFATAPGGSAEMTAAAEDMKANAAIVAALQTVRIIIVIAAVPTLLRWWLRP